MIIKKVGLLLSTTDYKENDLLCHILFEDGLRYTLIAKGAKKINARHVLPFVLAEFMFDYKEFKTISTLQHLNVLKNYYEFESLNRLSALNLIVDICKNTYNELETNLDLFNETKLALDLLNNDNHLYILAIYIAHIAKIMGISPIVDSCALCNNNRVVAISNEDGGFLCLEHAMHKLKHDVKTLKKFRLVYKMPYDAINMLKELDFNTKDFELVADFFFSHSDFNLKSYKFFKSLIIGF